MYTRFPQFSIGVLRWGCEPPIKEKGAIGGSGMVPSKIALVFGEFL